MKNLFAVLATLLFANSLVYAQREVVKNDFLAINNNYLAQQKLSMTISFNVYAENSSVSLDSDMGFYKTDNGKVNLKYFGTETLLNNGILISFNSEGRRIILDTLRGQYPVLPKSVPALYLDSLFKYYKDVTVSDVEGNQRKYEFIYQGGSFSKVEVFVNTTTLFINKIVNYLVEKQEITEGVYKNVRAEIEFSNVNTNPTYSTEFDTGRFVKKVEGVYLLAAPYSTFTLVNLL